MLLQFAVTQFKDGDACIKRLLDSIALQQDVDFNEVGVIIINDGDKLILKNETLQGYPFKIEYHIEKWSGLSGARQHGLDYATADYIQFCDGDDLYYRTNALWDCLRRLRDKHLDILTSKFVTDMFDRNTGKCAYFQEYVNDNVWIHGKMFKVDFLKNNNVKWCIPLMSYYEDSYFVRTAFACNPVKETIEEPTYFWKFRETSITRSDDDYILTSFDKKINSNAALVKNLLEHNKPYDAANYAFVQIYEAYFTFQEDYWKLEKYAPYKRPAELRMKQYLKDYQYLLDKVDNESACVMMEVLRRRFYKEKNRLAIEHITIDEWIEYIKNLED